jgi:hypothetical protein
MSKRDKTWRRRLTDPLPWNLTKRQEKELARSGVLRRYMHGDTLICMECGGLIPPTGAEEAGRGGEAPGGAGLKGRGAQAAP